MSVTQSWRGRGRLPALLIGILLVAGGGGVLIGHATADSVSNHADAGLPAVGRGTISTPHGPNRMDGELPVGFTDDKGGALSCAAVAAEALIDYVQVRRITSPSDWIAAYTTGNLDALSMQKVLDWNPAAYRLGRGDRPTQLAPRRHAVAVSELVPVGYKILAFSTNSAHLQIWVHGAGWSQGSGFPNTVVDRSADITLVWRAGDWKITSYTQPNDQTWDGPGLDDPAARGFAPWPGGQFTFVTG